MSQRDFDAIRAFVHRAFGIALSPAKMPLVKMRLRGILQRRGLSGASEYVRRVLGHPDAAAVSELADAITTNHTFFWRESSHFELLQQRVLPDLKRQQAPGARPSLRIWSAAASTGQEAYTLAAAVRLVLGQEIDRWDRGILATDLSARALEQARAARYTREEAGPLPEHYRRAMFVPSAGDELRIRDDLRADVTFRRLNLLAPFRFRRSFDAVFCRNVMIYFDDATKLDLASRIAAVLRPGGYLFLGLSESLGATPPGLRAVMPAVYQRPEHP